MRPARERGTIRSAKEQEEPAALEVGSLHASIQRCKAVHVANTQRVTTLHYEQQLGTHSSSGRAARAVRTTRNNEEAQAHLESGNNEERYGQGTTRNDGEQWGGMGSDEAEKAPTGNGREGGLPPRDLCRSFRAYTLSSRLTERKRLTDSPKMLKSYTLYKGVSDAATLSGSLEPTSRLPRTALLPSTKET